MSDDFLEYAAKRAKPLEQAGARIADDCLVNGLRRGQTIRLSEVAAQIAEAHGANALVVKTSFLQRMLELVRTGEIECFSVEGGESLFVHTNDVPGFLGSVESMAQQPSGLVRRSMEARKTSARDGQCRHCKGTGLVRLGRVCKRCNGLGVLQNAPARSESTEPSRNRAAADEVPPVETRKRQRESKPRVLIPLLLVVTLIGAIPAIRSMRGMSELEQRGITQSLETAERSQSPCVRGVLPQEMRTGLASGFVRGLCTLLEDSADDHRILGLHCSEDPQRIGPEVVVGFREDESWNASASNIELLWKSVETQLAAAVANAEYAHSAELDECNFVVFGLSSHKHVTNLLDGSYGVPVACATKRSTPCDSLISIPK